MVTGAKVLSWPQGVALTKAWIKDRGSGGCPDRAASIDVVATPLVSLVMARYGSTLSHEG
jgi:hypothetical protein